MTQFFVLKALESMVQGKRDDLSKLRAINATLQQKVKAQTNRTQFKENHIAAEVSKLREAARTEAGDYLVKEKTFEGLSAIKDQKEYWTVPAYLFRAPGTPDQILEAYDTTANTVKLMKTMIAEQRLANLLFSLSRMNEATIQTVADGAIAVNDWSKLGACYTELSGRQNEAAASLRFRMEAVEIPDIVAAHNLLEEGRQLQEFISYTIRSIGSGDRDLGIEMEGYAKTATDMNQAKLKAQAQNELDRQASVVQFQMGDLRPAA